MSVSRSGLVRPFFDLLGFSGVDEVGGGFVLASCVSVSAEVDWFVHFSIFLDSPALMRLAVALSWPAVSVWLAAVASGAFRFRSST